MKKSINVLQGLFLLLLCAIFLVSFSNDNKPAQFSGKVMPVNPAGSKFATRNVSEDISGCPKCTAVFDECTTANGKIFTDEVERVSDDFKAGKIKKEEMLKAFEVAKAANSKAITLCATTYNDCCLSEMSKAKAASKTKSKQ
jgi:hypothetical protein